MLAALLGLACSGTGYDSGYGYDSGDEWPTGLHAGYLDTGCDYASPYSNSEVDDYAIASWGEWTIRLASVRRGLRHE